MRVYHFIDAKFGLDDIRNRRLKVARIDRLNDPFEWQALTSDDPVKRRAITALKDDQAKHTGILCFSRDWHNPVQWSHYADHHRGLCLGFDVADELLGEVRYVLARPSIDDVLNAPTPADGNDRMRDALVTKFRHWRYEKEMRVFVRLNPEAEIKGLYFCDFSEQMRLSEVVVGSRSSITRVELAKALGNFADHVHCKKARLAFRTFNVVTQRRADMWL